MLNFSSVIEHFECTDLAGLEQPQILEGVIKKTLCNVYNLINRSETDFETLKTNPEAVRATIKKNMISELSVWGKSELSEFKDAQGTIQNVLDLVFEVLENATQEEDSDIEMKKAI